MARSVPRFAATISLLAMGCAAAGVIAPAKSPQDQGSIPSGVVSWDKVERSTNTWGEFRRIFGGETFGMKDLQVIAVTIQPGKQVHPVG